MSLLSKVINATLFRPFHILDALLPATVSGSSSSILTTTEAVRYRYHADKKKTWLIRRYGYEDKMDFRGPLPRIAESEYPVPFPTYMPPKNWTEKKALMGQNDYIDILGDREDATPIKFQTHIPQWLRGFQGNEYQMLLRKRALLGLKIRGRPTEWKNLRLRIKYLYRRLNYKTKSFMDKKSLRV